jgi:hypothetical protein
MARQPEGLYLHLGNLSLLSHARTRSISAENFTGEKGQGGMAIEERGAVHARELGQGWKVSPSVSINGNSTFTLAKIAGEAAIQHIWMTLDPSAWRRMILRMYWDGEEPHAPFPLLPDVNGLEVV